MRGEGVRVWGLGFGVWGLGLGGQGNGLGVRVDLFTILFIISWSDAEYR